MIADREAMVFANRRESYFIPRGEAGLQKPWPPFQRSRKTIFLCDFRTPFFLALMQDNAEMFEALLNHQPNMNTRGPSSL